MATLTNVPKQAKQAYVGRSPLPIDRLSSSALRLSSRTSLATAPSEALSLAASLPGRGQRPPP